MAATRRRRSRRVVALAAAASLAALGAGVGLAVVVARGLPKIQTIEDYRPPEATMVFAQGGELIGIFAEQRRTVVDIGGLPDHVIRAFLAAEDASFFQHEGIDYLGIARAALKNLRPGAHLQGASTITQQTVKTLLLGSERSYARKLREVYLARKLEKVLSKAEILHIYLNQIYFGHGLWGIEAASQAYFGKPAGAIDLGEAALLAAVPKFPSHYNPKTSPAAAKGRQRYVLEQMVMRQWAAPEAAAAAIAQPVPVPPPPPPSLGAAPHYLEHVRRLMVERLGEAELYTGGLRVTTALDVDLQAQATAATRTGIEQVAERQGWRGSALRLAAGALPERLTAWRQELAARASDGAAAIWDLRLAVREDLEAGAPARRMVRAEVAARGRRVRAPVTHVAANGQEARVDLGSRPGILRLAELAWARPFNPTEPTPRPRRIEEVVAVGDLVLVEVAAIPRDARRPLPLTLVVEPSHEGALVAIAPASRHVVALVGGYGAVGTGFNRATQALRQPGSAFKPILYAAGLTYEAITPASSCSDSPVVVLDPFTGNSWKPTNYEDGRYDGPITYRTALARSKNTCSVKLLQRLGLVPVARVARAMGVTSPLPGDLTLALGTGEMSLLELTNAFATIADQGVAAAPVFVTEVRRGDHTIFAAEPTGEVALSPSTAYVLTSMMQDVVARGTARAAAIAGIPLAAKTGTSQESRSVWLAGFAPSLAAGVWMGFDNNASLGRETGASAALPAWATFMRTALAGPPAAPAAMPEGVVTRRIERATGLVTHADLGPDVLDEVFLEGTEPAAEPEPKALRSIYLEDEPEDGEPAAP